MNLRTLLTTASLTVFLAACASQQEAPAPQPAPAPAPEPLAKPAPAPEPLAKPAPKPEPKKPAVVTLSTRELFDFNKASLTSEAKSRLDREVIGKLKDVEAIRYINVNGHADRIGSAQYNQKLSERRAEAVREYLVSRGADGAKIEVFGYGKTMPVKSCQEKDRQALIACLAPNRRVEVEIQGAPR